VSKFYLVKNRTRDNKVRQVQKLKGKASRGFQITTPNFKQLYLTIYLTKTAPMWFIGKLQMPFFKWLLLAP